MRNSWASVTVLNHMDTQIVARPGFTSCRPRARRRERGGARIVLVVVACLAAGFAGGAFWYHRATQSHDAKAADVASVKLSDGTTAVLQSLDSPVEIRFYFTPGPAGEFDPLREYASRVDALLAAYQAAGGSKVAVTRHEAQTNSTIAAAVADGLRPIRLESGNARYLGVVVVQDDQKETLPPLSPAWEPALESDLSRVIARVAATRRLAVQAANNDAANQAAAEAMKRSLPGFESVSAEKGAQLLRQAGLKEIKAGVEELEARVEQAEAALVKAKNGGSPAEQEAARAGLLKLHAEQAENFQEIAIRYQAQVGALERLKNVRQPRPTPVQTNLVGEPKR